MWVIDYTLAIGLTPGGHFLPSNGLTIVKVITYAIKP